MKKGFFIPSFLLVMLFIGDIALAADGAKIYANICSACHGMKGEGTAMAPAHKGNKFVIEAPAEEIKKVIKNGRSGKAKKYPNFPIDMPAQSTMPEADLDALVKFMKGDLQKK